MIAVSVAAIRKRSVRPIRMSRAGIERDGYGPVAWPGRPFIATTHMTSPSSGLDKPVRTQLSGRDYERVRELGDEYLARNPRSLA
jgi:hypothetical protein